MTEKQFAEMLDLMRQIALNLAAIREAHEKSVNSNCLLAVKVSA